ncbi:M20/M25/M40 family metallo-hydrolase [Pendulispora albinea]|uniref:M20/M25/M40 family metallo-hydrolase n=1 Tax=Pendulispora albinea TaxID=2741071 RepID=A0ABZ2MAA5_9BACT
MGWSAASALLVGLACSSSDSDSPRPPSGDACATIEEDVLKSFDVLAKFVSVQTWREPDSSNEAQVQANIDSLKAELKRQIDEVNAVTKKDDIATFDWAMPNADAEPGDPKTFKVFGAKLGRGKYKVALLAHLDTVPPGDPAVWDAFKLKKETRKSLRDGKDQEYWVGRGSADDKGPAIGALDVLKAMARAYDGSPLLDRVTVEIIFDTSEETSFSTTHYFDANKAEEPDLAVVFDSSWCVRAEKGIERPIFTIAREAPPTTGVWIDSLDTGPGATNQIPDSVTAVLKSGADADSKNKLAALASGIANRYAQHPFDDPAYRRAKLTVDTSTPGQIKLTTKVEGAQHGSRPQENRQEGANPLISLANFLGALVQDKTLADNDVGRMAEFVAWGWGTKAFGEPQRDLLEAHDDVFTAPDSAAYADKNGTTYAITRFYTGTDTANPNTISLRVDIRYALDHHGVAWDHTTEGFVGGAGSKSVFQDRFTQLVQRFNALRPGRAVTFKTSTIYAPDVRLPNDPAFSSVSKAFKEVFGQECPALATGGGTDAKGHLNFLAAGPAFTDQAGPPFNFHGLNEGMPARDMALGAKVICKWVDGEIQRSPTVTTKSLAAQASLRTQWATGPHEDVH